MSDRDPVLHGPYSPSFNHNTDSQMNPAASNFAPTGPRQNSTTNQVSASSSPHLEARILGLELGHEGLQKEIGTLKELFHGLTSSVGKLKKGGWPVHVGPFQDVDIKTSHEDAKQFSQQLERLKNEAHGSGYGSADELKANGSISSKTKDSSVNSDNTVKKSLPPHLRVKKLDSSNGTLSLPLSPDTTVQDQPSIKHLSLNNEKTWKPYHLTTLARYSGEVPPSDTSVTFHPDFLTNHLGGTVWSPGLRFVGGRGPCILKNRTYYQIDPENEPYLPRSPGEHGAKLTAFFNKAPEEEFGHLLDEDSNSYGDVPMFVLVGKRYMYYGNYSQTRWSDKLDHDTMTTKVPDHVKNFWAEELTAPTREKWVTEELKKHFFRKPEYEGCLYAAPDNGTIDSEEEVKLTEKMTKDVRKYIDELRQWVREADMKTAMIKKQSIIDAFNASDMDEAPALRLWWEYLECVDWRRDFYDLLVTLQAREGGKYVE